MIISADDFAARIEQRWDLARQEERDDRAVQVQQDADRTARLAQVLATILERSHS